MVRVRVWLYLRRGSNHDNGGHNIGSRHTYYIHIIDRYTHTECKHNLSKGLKPHRNSACTRMYLEKLHSISRNLWVQHMNTFMTYAISVLKRRPRCACA